MEKYGSAASRVPAGVRRAPDEVAPAWEAALSADRPCVLDVVADSDVPPPPHISLEQATRFALAALKGDPGASEMVDRSLRDKLAELLPRRSGRPG